jgi:hypothetical protein
MISCSVAKQRLNHNSFWSEDAPRTSSWNN